MEVLQYYKIHLSQLTPNAVSYIIGFEVLCRSQGREFNVECTGVTGAGVIRGRVEPEAGRKGRAIDIQRQT